MAPAPAHAASDAFPAAQLLQTLGIDRSGVKATSLYCLRMRRPQGVHGPLAQLLYVGAERATPYAAALGADGGPAHPLWRNVPQVVRNAWRNHYRLVDRPAQVTVQHGQETATVYALRLALRGTCIEVCGGLYAMLGTSAPEERPLIRDTVT